MIDKFFGFTRVHDEVSIIDSLLEHTRIDEEEILLLKNMLTHLLDNDNEQLLANFNTLKKINNASSRVFEATVEQIIHANFDHQKQYDLLRLFQRIENISGAIISAAKRLVILYKIGEKFPNELKEPTTQIADALVEIHELFRKSLEMYHKNKKGLIHSIHEVIEMEHQIDNMRVNCIEILYKLGNKNSIAMGTFRAIENIIVHLEELSDEIEDASTSLEWLLIY
jgi:uncharacterized protein Yka (UPF0111/DUF47 family)